MCLHVGQGPLVWSSSAGWLGTFGCTAGVVGNPQTLLPCGGCEEVKATVGMRAQRDREVQT